MEGLGYSSNGLLILRRLLLFLILLFCGALSVSQDPGDSAEIKEIWGSGFEFFLYWVLFFKYLSIYAVGCWLRGKHPCQASTTNYGKLISVDPSVVLANVGV